MDAKVVKPRAGLQLRRIGRQYMIVEASAGNVNMSYVYSLNRTAAQLWERLSQGDFTEESLALWLADLYGIAPDEARRDVRRQLSAWSGFGLIE